MIQTTLVHLQDNEIEVYTEVEINVCMVPYLTSLPALHQHDLMTLCLCPYYKV